MKQISLLPKYIKFISRGGFVCVCVCVCVNVSSIKLMYILNSAVCFTHVYYCLMN